MTQSSLLGTTFFGLDLTQIIERLTNYRRQVSRKVLLLEFASSSLTLAQIGFSEQEVNFTSVTRVSLPEGAVERGVPTDPAKMASLIKSICKKEGIRARRTAVVLPADVAFTKLLNLPSTLTPEQAREYVSNPEAGLQIPIPLSQTDFDIAPTVLPIITEGSLQVKPYFLTAIPERLVSQLIETLQAADLELTSVDLSFNCQLRLFSADIAGLCPGDVLIHLEFTLDCTYMTFVGASGPLSLVRLSTIREFTLPELDDIQSEAALAESLSGESLVLGRDGYMPLSELDLRAFVHELRDAMNEFSSTLPYVVWKGVALAGVNSAHPQLEALLRDVLSLKSHTIRPLGASGVGQVSFRTVFIFQELGRLMGLGLRFLPHDALVACSLDQTSDQFSFHDQSVAVEDSIDVSLRDELIYQVDSGEAGLHVALENLSPYASSAPPALASTQDSGTPHLSTENLILQLGEKEEEAAVEEGLGVKEEEKEEEWPSLQLGEKEGAVAVEDQHMAIPQLVNATTRAEYQALTVQELKVLCSKNKLSGYKSMNKSQIILLLISNHISPPQIPLERMTKKQLIEKIKRLSSG